MISALIGAALLGWLHPRPSDMHGYGYGIGAWRLEVHTDSFTRSISCTLWRRAGLHQTRITSEIAEFNLGGRVDPETAWVRIDDQKPAPWSLYRSREISAGALFVVERLNGAAPAILRLPISTVQNARAVTIRPADGRRPITFKMERLNDALQAAHTLGCPRYAKPESAGVAG